MKKKAKVVQPKFNNETEEEKAARLEDERRLKEFEAAVEDAAKMGWLGLGMTTDGAAVEN